MTTTPRRPWRRRLAGLALIILLASAGRLIDFPRLQGGLIGDQATYMMQALSLAEDADLHYTAEDLARFYRLYGNGPSGIFLKLGHTLHWSLSHPFAITKTTDPQDQSLEYGKAFIYPFVAAPFVALGGLGGMFILNILLCGGCLWCGIRFGRARTAHWSGGALAVVFILGSSVPIWLVWLTSEFFNFSLVFFAYFLWLYKEVAPQTERRTWIHGPWSDVASVVLIGAATFSKISHAPLIVPMVVYALWKRRWVHATLLTGLFMLTTVGLYGVNAVVTGEANYQGGEDRRSFYDLDHKGFPLGGSGVVFGEQGTSQLTNESDWQSMLAPEMIPALGHNVIYYLLGRDAGVIPYYFPGAVIGLLWLLRLRQATMWQTVTLLACLGSVLVFLLFLPYTWNGGGGPPGNRYFLSLYPTLLFLMPASVGLLPVVVAIAGGAVFTAPMLVHPFAVSARPWESVDRAPLRWLPIELTLMDDLPVRLFPPRSRIPFHSNNPDVFVYLYYMDSHTYLVEDEVGFWIAPGTAEIVVRAERPLASVKLVVTSPFEAKFTASFGGRSTGTTIVPKATHSLEITRPSGVRYVHGSYSYVLRLTSEAPGFVPQQLNPASPDRRLLAVFVKPIFTEK